MKIGLYLTFNDAYIKGAIVTIYSFIKNNEWFSKMGGDIIIAYPDNDKLSAENKEIISKLYSNIIFIEINSSDEKYLQFDKIMGKGLKKRFGPIIYKFNAFTLKEYDRIVIMDVDFLVKENISELFLKEDIKFGAVIDKYFNKYLTEFTKRHDEYFNVGIMSVGNEYLNDNIINEAIDIIKNDKLKTETEVFTFKGEYPEQDILNLIMSKYDVTLMPSKYNGYDFKTSCQEYACIHYMTSLKPWKFFNSLYPSWNIWYEYYNEAINFLNN